MSPATCIIATEYVKKIYDPLKQRIQQSTLMIFLLYASELIVYKQVSEFCFLSLSLGLTLVENICRMMTTLSKQ